MAPPSDKWATWCERPGCSKPIAKPGATRIYCSNSCRSQAGRTRKNDWTPFSKHANNVRAHRASQRKGPRYLEFVESWAPRIISGELSNTEVATQIGISPSEITRWLAALREDVRNEIHSKQVAAEQVGRPIRLSFSEFRAQFFHTVNPKGTRVPYATPDFQGRWIGSVDDAISQGDRLMILSPPRHGKTELLIHFVIYRICMQPNIRILWVGLNEDIAKQSVELVKAELEHNQDLIRIYGGSTGFRPRFRSSGAIWTASQIVVATRTTALKSNTLTAVGRGGKLLSRDADLIILDDIVDHSTTNSPAQRESDSRWLRTQISSRKEQHTAIVAIGSRQHPEDIYQGMLDSKVWTSIVESVHAPDCTIEPTDLKAHVDCMLFPAMRSYEWAMNMRDDLGALLFDMVYMNVSTGDGIRTFSLEVINRCKSPDHRIGQHSRKLRLIAGLDPATTGYQAAVLWAVDVDKMVRYLVDLENTKGGGLPGARALVREWFSTYGLRHWVVEGNNFQSALRQDLDIMAFSRANGIKLEGHFTHGFNKWDPQFGVTSMASLFADNKIVLPYADIASAEKTDAYVKQLLRFEGQGTGRQKYASDLVMAGWFPETQIRRWRVEHVRSMQVEYDQTDYPWQSAADQWGSVLTGSRS